MISWCIEVLGTGISTYRSLGCLHILSQTTEAYKPTNEVNNILMCRSIQSWLETRLSWKKLCIAGWNRKATPSGVMLLLCVRILDTIRFLSLFIMLIIPVSILYTLHFIIAVLMCVSLYTLSVAADIQPPMVNYVMF